MAAYRVSVFSTTQVDDTYSATVELTKAEKAGADKLLAALGEAQADYAMPRRNPRAMIAWGEPPEEE